MDTTQVQTSNQASFADVNPNSDLTRSSGVVGEFQQLLDRIAPSQQQGVGESAPPISIRASQVKGSNELAIEAANPALSTPILLVKGSNELAIEEPDGAEDGAEDLSLLAGGISLAMLVTSQELGLILEPSPTATSSNQIERLEIRSGDARAQRLKAQVASSMPGSQAMIWGRWKSSSSLSIEPEALESSDGPAPLGNRPKAEPSAVGKGAEASPGDIRASEVISDRIEAAGETIAAQVDGSRYDPGLEAISDRIENTGRATQMVREDRTSGEAAKTMQLDHIVDGEVKMQSRVEKDEALPEDDPAALEVQSVEAEGQKLESKDPSWDGNATEPGKGMAATGRVETLTVDAEAHVSPVSADPRERESGRIAEAAGSDPIFRKQVQAQPEAEPLRKGDLAPSKARGQEVHVKAEEAAILKGLTELKAKLEQVEHNGARAGGEPEAAKSGREPPGPQMKLRQTEAHTTAHYHDLAASNFKAAPQASKTASSDPLSTEDIKVEARKASTVAGGSVGQGLGDPHSFELLSAAGLGREASVNYTLPTQSPDAMERRDIIRQIVQEAKLLLSGEASEIRLTLKPEFLGRLHIKASVVNDQVVAVIAAESSQVGEYLSSNLDILHAALSEQGLEVDRIQIRSLADPSASFFGGYLQGSPQRQNLNFAFQNPYRPVPQDEDTALEAEEQMLPIVSGRINLLV